MFRWLKREPKQVTARRQALLPLLMEYPVYEPPHAQCPNYLRRHTDQTEEAYSRYIHEYIARSEENFLFFMEQRLARLSALQAFLGRLDVSASLDDAGLASVSTWFPDNGYALADFRDQTVCQAFYQMKAPWIKELRGLNVLFDLGIFFGEVLIRRQSYLHWKFVHGSSDNGQSNGTGYTIQGF